MQKAVDLRAAIVQVAVDKAEIELTRKLAEERAYVDTCFAGLLTTMNVHFASIQVAVDKAELELTRKLAEERAYVDTRFADLLATMNVHFASIQVAIDKAEVTINTRLEGMNEIRDQLKDQSAQFVARSESAGTIIKDQVAQLVTRSEFASIQKLVYIGLGAVLAIELLLKFITK